MKQSKTLITMTAKIVKKRGGAVLFDVNPFLTELTTRTRRITNQSGNMMLINSESGEITAPVAGFWKSEIVDSTKFVKLFVQGVSALKELSNAGTKVFEVLYLRVRDSIGKDQVYMSFALVDQVLTPMSEATYTRGMRELLEKGFIAASPHIGLYWLNPSFIWNGDRLAFVQEYRKKSTKDNLSLETNENQISLDI
jgi:hypothetical protein